MKHTEETYILKLEKSAPEIKDLEGFKWYLVSTQSNCESKARKNIAARAVLMDVTDNIDQIIFPYYEKEVRNPSGTKRKKIMKIYNNYLFIYAKMDEKVYEVIKHADKVTGFVQSGKNLIEGLPKPIMLHEVKNALKKMEEFKEGVISLSKFKEGDQVKILEGIFKDHIGTVDKIDGDLVTVSVFVLGKSTDMNIAQKNIEKVE